MDQNVQEFMRKMIGVIKQCELNVFALSIDLLLRCKQTTPLFCKGCTSRSSFIWKLPGNKSSDFC